LKSLVNELMLYDPLLAAKPAIVIANKMDAKGAPEGVKKLRSASALPVIEVSAKEKIGVGQAVDALRFILEAMQQEEYKIFKATLERNKS
jgi:GTPase involved in cell partitioning and DNA repair